MHNLENVIVWKNQIFNKSNWFGGVKRGSQDLGCIPFDYVPLSRPSSKIETTPEPLRPCLAHLQDFKWGFLSLADMMKCAEVSREILLKNKDKNLFFPSEHAVRPSQIPRTVLLIQIISKWMVLTNTAFILNDSQAHVLKSHSHSLRMNLVKNKHTGSSTEAALARGRNTGPRLHLLSHKTLCWMLHPSLHSVPFFSISASWCHLLSLNFLRLPMTQTMFIPFPKDLPVMLPWHLVWNFIIWFVVWHVFTSMFLSTMLWEVL